MPTKKKKLNKKFSLQILQVNHLQCITSDSLKKWTYLIRELFPQNHINIVSCNLKYKCNFPQQRGKKKKNMWTHRILFYISIDRTKFHIHQKMLLVQCHGGYTSHFTYCPNLMTKMKLVIGFLRKKKLDGNWKEIDD